MTAAAVCFVLSLVSLVFVTHTDSFVRSCLVLLKKTIITQNKLQCRLWHQQLQFVLLCHWCHSSVTGAITHSEGWSPIIRAVLLLLDEYKDSTTKGKRMTGVWCLILQWHQLYFMIGYLNVEQILTKFPETQLRENANECTFWVWAHQDKLWFSSLVPINFFRRRGCNGMMLIKEYQSNLKWRKTMLEMWNVGYTFVICIHLRNVTISSSVHTDLMFSSYTIFRLFSGVKLIHFSLL